MARRQIARYLSIPFRINSTPSVRSFHVSLPLSLAISLPLSDILHQLDSVNTSHSIRTHKLAELQSYLSWHNPTPSRVWALYLGTVNLVGVAAIPLELHQDVLRKCTISPSEIRKAVAQFTSLDDANLPTHIHEERFRTVVRNIRSANCIPSLEDYHFVLRHFAAAGYHIGSMNIFQELVSRGPRPSPKTYGLCLQAIAHRLTLPCSNAHKPALLADTRKDCTSILNQMSSSKVPLTSVNLDLAVRILKETLDRKAFESLLKIAYNIDLAYPDRLPDPSVPSTSDLPVSDLPTQHPFSTAALNTIIDMLGRLGDISKLVQAFETLTQPLPIRALQQYSPSFDDDDCIIPQPTPNVRPASAVPNTTTYNILLRHISKAGHAVFARHYLIQALDLEWRTDRALCGDLLRKPFHEVPSPHFAVNRATILPVFGECNRDKNMQLMRWLSSKFPKILRRKRKYLDWHTRFRASLLEKNSSLLTGADSTPIPVVERQPGTIPALDVDLDAPPIPPAPFRRFNCDAHIKILRRDIEELEVLAAKVDDVIGRTTQRVKERLGRRVWQNKDVYLLSEGARVKISRQTWRKLVNFQPRCATPKPPWSGSRNPGTRLSR